MKLKEVDRTAMQAWSPAQNHPIYLATGTSAQQLDATFSTNASLEIFELDLSDPSLDMQSCATFSSSHRYHKLIWGPHKMDSKGNISGVLIAGGENGNIILYDPSKIIAGEKEVVIAQNDKHTGPVRALDVNIFQTNLVASGANESEIYIWDLNNFATPMTPGAKTQPPEDISCIAWNRQVQHILASASPSGRATVWDLRKNEPIIKVSDHNNRMHCSGLAWHPEVATQMVLSSEDDRLPVVQVWDLRFASTPLRVLENHARGILAIAWSMADPELLLSCGKDAKILCSNPNTGEVLYELPTNTQWCFDIQWCPRNPAVLSAASFDGRISVYSIMGGNADGLRQKQVHKLSSSFGNLDPFGTGQPLPPLQIPQQAAQHHMVLPLKKPPKWIRRPIGASFSFGGRLVTFENVKTPSQQGAEQQQQQQQQHVFISQVVTEKEFLSRSDQLQQVMQSQGFVKYCQKKIDASQSEFEKNVWSFLKVNFEDDSRGKYLELLGYRKEDLGKKIALALNKVDGPDMALKDSDQVAQSDGEESPAAEEQLLGEHIKEEKQEFEFLPSAGGPFNISINGDIDGLITQALLMGNFESAVDLCLHDNRMADAIILAIAGGQELLARTQKKYFAKSQSKITRLITAVVMKNWKEIVESCDLKNWREALAAVLTYAKPDEFSALCDLLGTRLESEGDSPLQSQACLCYICAGNVEKLVACWTKAQDGSNPLSLQDLIEKVVILRKAVQLTQAMDTNTVGVLLAEKMSQYASLLAAQGSIAAALAFLPESANQPNIVQLRDRLCRAQGEPILGQESPKVPYERQQLPKGRPGPVAGYTQMPRVAPQQYYPHVRIAPTVTTWSNKTPTALPSHPPAASPSDTQGENPPPPGFLMHGNINPNVATAQLSTSPGHMHTQVPPYPQPQPYQPAQPYFFGTGGSATYQPQQPVAPSASNTYPNTPYISSASSYSGQSQLYAAQHQVSPPTSSPSASFPPPPSSGASFQHGGPGAPPSSAYALPPGTTGTLPAASELPASQRTENQFIQDQAPLLEGSQNGWNDPPALNRVPKKKKMPENFMPPIPITSPITNPLGDPQSQMLQQQPSAPAPLSSQPSFPQPHLPGGQPSFPGMQQPLGQPGMPPSFSKPNIEGAPGAPIGNTIQHVQSLPTEKITKKPIPDEHLILKTTFEDLIQRCLSSATDPQTKRKLDDASKRLEFLYDKLREQTLSPIIISGLHNIARSIEMRNYSEGLSIHTHIVSTSNFSETSAFMPVLKVVLTQANKLGV
ncbi:protein transport protein Sec31A isoform X1 [Sturnira hondurensis]|uniref:protein transport protein Sec31A isoform X1 n=1 Tax=Sturnira hondurensis TaxID=192404 RepID=UPI00187A72E2|nr:protein transport protein Sec31A isoform X1 [Sturnira hondurensis]XP_036891544.1 protein transport protein Sec31A isoform X1 [Sturnira hondurensis]XP_036891545.1 protein transport protein Sec31A isoform X1 [Sturnira hondurensis]XP_036891546.1 protein transport protein Sec31A isoform X1 [Sturnira hondurensis]XP_036891547.1 protein transport protein Sec31A isoform X1 [Sturnira hondurensis]XP_036891549.1 protein transport protein Sec31A isoform X1 [Sturnira hondurensis]XP_036891550.1 protein 